MTTVEDTGKKRPIGEMLISAGLISRVELQDALMEQRNSGQRLVSILISQGIITSQDFVNFLAEPGEFETLELSQVTIEERLIELIPKNFALLNEVVPVDLKGDVLTVAMMCPLDSTAIQALENHTKYRIKPLLCPADDVQQALDHHYRDEDDSQPLSRTIEGPLKLATAVTMLRHIDSLPALPGTVRQVRQLLQNSDPSAVDVANIISRDPAVSAKMLKVANSAVYGLPHKVDNVHLAVSLLGMLETYSVVVSSAVINLLDRSRAFDYVVFWLESTVCANVSRALANMQDARPRPGIFSAGLLRDLGRVALAEVAPKHYGKIDSKLAGKALIEAEERQIGLTHTEAGYQLARHWDFPDILMEVIRFHHTPEYASDENRDAVSIVSIADVVSRAHRADSESRTPNFEECEESLDFLKITKETVMEIFHAVSTPDPDQSAWSEN